MKITKTIVLFFLYVIATCACSTVKHIENDQYLLRKNKLKVTTDLTISEKSIINDQLKQLISPKTNTYLLGFIPYKIWLYNLRYKKFNSDANNFQITSRTVEKPIVLDTDLIDKTKLLMNSYLNNQGYFYPRIISQIDTSKKQKATVTYEVHTGKRYSIDSSNYAITNAHINSIVLKDKNNSFFKPNIPYSNTLAGLERARIVTLVRNNGYYHFSAQNIYFELDTFNTIQFQFKKDFCSSLLHYLYILNHPKLNITTIINDANDSLSFKRYTFNNINIFPDYKNNDSSNSKNYIIEQNNNANFYFHKSYVNANILRKKIAFNKGDYFSQDSYDNTLRQLNDLGLFQFVRIKYEPIQTDSLHQLNCNLYLSPADKYVFNTNIEASNGNLYTSTIGTAANLSITDHNFLKGANRLTTTFSYGIELARNSNLPTSYWKQLYIFSQNLGVNFQLDFPKLLLPFNTRPTNNTSLPHTLVNVGFNSLIRSGYFTMQTFNAGFGYTWNKNKIKTWTIHPVFINTLHLSNISDSFQQKMVTIPAIKNSYQEAFIEGERVEYLYNNEALQPYNNSYIHLGLEEAGLLMSGIKAIGKGFDKGFTLNHAQYTRLDFDLRQYFKKTNSIIALRFYGGIGIPYANSKTLPYIKQYFSGGAYSIRGWRPRVLGPGSYYDSVQQNSKDNLFIDQSGDIKLELNGEYRFKILRLFSGAVNLNGAIFADAGNIWLAQKDSLMPGANFHFNTLYQDIAMSAGAGLRLDFGGYLVLRLDLAIPIKKPYIKSNNGWVIDEINFIDPVWRRKNMNLNIAIGYPF